MWERSEDLGLCRTPSSQMLFGLEKLYKAKVYNKSYYCKLFPNHFQGWQFIWCSVVYVIFFIEESWKSKKRYCFLISQFSTNVSLVEFSSVCSDYFSYFWFTFSKTPFHCVKSVRIRSYSGLYFPAFGLNTEKYPVLVSGTFLHGCCIWQFLTYM